MRKLQYFFAVTLLTVLMPVVALAAVVRTGEEVSITNDQVVADDFYAAGGTVSSSGDVAGDFYVAASTYKNNGTVDGDVVVIAGTAQIHASVTDDVRIVAGEVTIAGPIAGDLVVVGGTLEILSTATVGGDVLFYGGDIRVLGDVGGSVMGTSESIRIDAVVGGSVDIRTGGLTLGDRAEIGGDVAYVSAAEMVRSQNAIIVGEVIKGTPQIESAISYDNIVISFVIMLFTALLLQLLLRPQITQMIPVWTEKTGISGLLGIAGIVSFPILVVLALASMLGVQIGLLLLFVFLTLICVSIALTSIMVGATIAKYAQGITEPQVLYTIGGAIVLQLCLFIPVIGFFVVLMSFFVTFGGIMLWLFRLLRS